MCDGFDNYYTSKVTRPKWSIYLFLCVSSLFNDYLIFLTSCFRFFQLVVEKFQLLISNNLAAVMIRDLNSFSNLKLPSHKYLQLRQLGTYHLPFLRQQFQYLEIIFLIFFDKLPSLQQYLRKASSLRGQQLTRLFTYLGDIEAFLNSWVD